jgi:hypothetical protein
LKIPLGKHIETGQLKLIRELNKETERGLKCQCVCVGCGSALVARMGETRAHYFAHYRKEDYTQVCGETAIHLLAKIILSRRKKALFPLHMELCELHDDLYEKLISQISVFREPTLLIEPVEELYLPTANFKPDIFAKFELYGELHDVAIEIAVTHFVDDDKHLKATESNINMLEIDLSKLRLDKDITEESVEKALMNIRNWKWIHKDPSWVSQVKGLAEKDVREKEDQRNSIIKDWCDKLREHYKLKGKIRLPRYVYSDTVNNPRIHSDQSRPISVTTIPPKPTVDRILETDSIGELVGGVIEFRLKYNNEIYSLPLRLTRKGPSQFLQTKTHLILSPQLDNLPEMELFERVIYWGYNESAMDYESLVKENLKQKQTAYDSKGRSRLFRETQKNIQLYEDYLSGRKPPIATNIEKIKAQARKYWVEMKRKGIPVSDILQDVDNGWIFGCDQIWQVLVMYIMCVDGSAHGRSPDIYKQLRNEFNFYPLWPLGELHRNSSTLLNLDYDIKRLIDPEEVITAYLYQLSAVRVVMPPVGRGYEKRFKCGHRFLEVV